MNRLAAAGCVAAEEEADELLAAASDPAALDALLARREHGEPLPWLTGFVWFGGRALHVDAGVYVPRVQSEELAARAAAVLPPGGRALDLCTGAGAIAAHLAAEVPGAWVVGVDRDPLAARCAARNGVRALVGDLAAPVRAVPRFDVVTAVAPYVPTPALSLLPADVQRYEPRAALDGGGDGLDVVRRVVAAARSSLVRGGSLLIELGGDQDRILTPELAAAGFDAVTPWHDEEGDLRGIEARRT